jgi:hypothetical protein
MTRRTGSSLIEVLVAIFIMGIGMIALLTLFPIGALRMAQAIQDERAQQAGYNAHALSIIHNVHNDPRVISDGVIPDFFVNPNAVAGLFDADPEGQSYPVFVDPIGFQSSLKPSQDFVANYQAIRRTIPSGLLSDADIYRKFSLIDELVFDAVNGTPQISGNSVLRDTRYSWAYLLQRPRTADPSIVTCATVVFNRRPLALTTGLSLPEYLYQNQALFDVTNNIITIKSPTPPPVGAGDWILDATYSQRKVNGVDRGSAHGYFYRIVSVNDIGGNTYQYEVQTPLRGPWAGVSQTSINPVIYQGTVIFLEGVAEVFERGPVRLP